MAHSAGLTHTVFVYKFVTRFENSLEHESGASCWDCLMVYASGRKSPMIYAHFAIGRIFLKIEIFKNYSILYLCNLRIRFNADAKGTYSTVQFYRLVTMRTTVQYIQY
jgi:hypothetical protein